jgi:long-subunit fatty acid transport protein
MKKQLAVALSLAVTGAVQAGGIERTSQSVGILFEVGRYAEFSIGNASPSVSGVASPGAGGAASGNMAPDYTSVALGYKQDIGNNFDVALIIDQPVGADVSYPTSATGYPFAGSTATVDSTALTGLLRYKMANNVSLIGGLRYESVEGEVALPPAFGNYTLEVGADKELGYVAGIAYEKPEIALRTVLTYNSERKHTFDNVKEFGGPSAPFTTIIPKSVNLEFQSGVAKDTLVFGSIRWVEWSKFKIAPAAYLAFLSPNPLVDFEDDRITYNLGVGRRLNDKWSAAVSLGYEPSKGGISGNLSPTDGFKSIGLGVSYKMKKAKITAGVRYVDIGDATTSTIGAKFNDNDAIGVGLKVGYTF